ncbi:collagen alpha-1(XXV) chain [Garra rufa]|uniref:collagen alpha-1(XXV) chain n=1 Tax=Garra rufa TaxID=137080 RepID=UPI003CCE8C9F
MDQSADGNTESKQNAAKPLYQRYLVSFPTVVCLVLSLSSIAVCFLMTFKTHQMESRLRELETKMTDICQESPKDVSVPQELRKSFETLLQERLTEEMPKLRVARDVTQDCNCPPGPPGKRGRMGRRGDPALLALGEELQTLAEHFIYIEIVGRFVTKTPSKYPILTLRNNDMSQIWALYCGKADKTFEE